jgi:hypothetical protein
MSLKRQASNQSYTLGPHGPLLHKGVLVVLQSEHTLITPRLGWLLMSSYACALLLGFFAAMALAPWSALAFLVILILAGGVQLPPTASMDPPTCSCNFPISYGSYEVGSIMSSRMLSTVGIGVVKTLDADDTPIIW